jgi:hypothetical protein
VGRISWEVRISSGTIRRHLLKAGIRLRHPSARGLVCVDCGKPITTGKRCAFHRKVRKAQLNREFNRAKYGWKARIEC